MAPKTPKLGRPRKGTEARITRSVRMEPEDKILIEGKYGTVQNWFDGKFKEEFGEIYEARIVKSKVKKEEKEEISVEDF